MNIKTHYNPVPDQDPNWNWSAYDGETYDGSPGQPVGYGKTEADAIDDLLECMEERRAYEEERRAEPSKPEEKPAYWVWMGRKYYHDHPEADDDRSRK